MRRRAEGSTGCGPRRWPLALAVAWASGPVGGCAPEATPGRFGDQDVAAGDASDGAAVDASYAAGWDGTWLQVVEWSTCVHISEAVETRAYRVLKVEIQRMGARLKEKRTLCELRLTPLMGLQTTVPQPLVDAHPVMTLESVLVGPGDAGTVYLGGAEVQRFGIEMADPLGEAMPAKGDTSDPRLRDSESDGKPGATFHVGPSCSIHIAQREIGTLQGKVVAAGRVEGGGAHVTEQVVFGSTKAICGQTFTTVANDPHNRFVMVRADAFDDDDDGDLTCQELRAHAAEVMAAAPANDAACPALP